MSDNSITLVPVDYWTEYQMNLPNWIESTDLVDWFDEWWVDNKWSSTPWYDIMTKS